MIRIEHLRKEFADVTPLKDVSATINDGDVISVIGPSGTGKSTLLRCVNLLEQPTDGRIWIDGEEITAPTYNPSKVRQKVGMVFQSFNLFGHLTAIENIMLSPVTLQKIGKQEAYDRGMQLLRKVGLADKAMSYPDELSGGQQQRIAIVRTLAMNPSIILLDEPTSALDPTMVGEVQSVIRELADTDKTLMIVTHEMGFAQAISTRVFYMDQGVIYEEGSTQEIFQHPRRERTRRFIRRLKVLELRIESRDYDFLGMTSEIESYCLKNQIAFRLSNHIQLVFEELVHQVLMPRLEDPNIVITIEYATKEESASLTARYGGALFDATAVRDDLPMSLLKGSSTQMSYTWLEDDELPNRIVVNIRS